MPPNRPAEPDRLPPPPRHLFAIAHWQEIDALIRQADVKAQVLLGIDALLLAALSRSDGSPGGVAPVDTFLEYLTLLVLLASVAMALSTIAPRLGQPPDPRALFYFRAIRQLPMEQFVAAYTAQDGEEMLGRVARELHVKSTIADRKLQRIRLSALLLGGAACTWAAALVVGL